MEYSDNLIPSAEDFAKMAKEYSSRLKHEKYISNVPTEIDKNLLLNINSILKDLIFLYGYIKRNIRSVKLKSFFLYMEEECMSDLKLVKNILLDKNESSNKYKKQLSTFHFCVKSAISKEADLLSNTINSNSEAFFKDLSIKHIEFIKKLSNF